MSVQVAFWIALAVAFGLLIGLAMRPSRPEPQRAESPPAWPTADGDDPSDLHSTVVESASPVRGYIEEAR